MAKEVKKQQKTKAKVLKSKKANVKRRKMTTYSKNGRRYYTTQGEALAARRKGDRIYYDAYERAYYIVRPQIRSGWWN